MPCLPCRAFATLALFARPAELGIGWCTLLLFSCGCTLLWCTLLWVHPHAVLLFHVLGCLPATLLAPPLALLALVLCPAAPQDQPCTPPSSLLSVPSPLSLVHWFLHPGRSPAEAFVATLTLCHSGLLSPPPSLLRCRGLRGKHSALRHPPHLLHPLQRGQPDLPGVETLAGGGRPRAHLLRQVGRQAGRLRGVEQALSGWWAGRTWPAGCCAALDDRECMGLLPGRCLRGFDPDQVVLSL